MEGGSTSEPWTCERGMKEHASERGFCDKVRPVTSREVVPKRYAFSSRILSISLRMRLSHETPEANRAGIRVGVRDETRGVRKCHVAVRVSKAPNGTSGF